MVPFFMHSAKSKTRGTENKPVGASFWKQREELITKRHKRIWGMMKLFYILIEVSVTRPNVKT